MSRRIIELREEETSRFPREFLLEADILALNRAGKFEIELASIFNNNTHGIRSRGWVGQIPIGDDLLVRVTPKVAVANLFRMLEIAYNLRSFRLFDGELHIENLDDVYERIVSILNRRILNRSRKGLYRGYVNEAQDLPYVRGRIDILGTAMNGARGIARIPCNYEEHTADLEDNRIILWTLHQVRRQLLRQEKVRIGLDRARRALSGTITLHQYSPNDCVDRFYHRLNDDYAPMHGLCRFILEQTGPGFQAGDRTFIPFELNMPNLFQSFVAEWLRMNIPKGLDVRPQYHAKLNANFEIAIEIDILLWDENLQRPVAVLDTKYKANEKPSETDIYQIAFYARELGVDRAILVYPSALTVPFQMRHGNSLQLESAVFDIGISPDVAGNAFMQALKVSLS